MILTSGPSVLSVAGPLWNYTEHSDELWAMIFEWK